MIIATVTAIILLMGGSSFSFEKALKPSVEEAIPDKDLRKAVLNIAKEMDEERKSFSDSMKEHGSDLSDLNRKRTLSSADYDKFFEGTDKRRDEARQRTIDLRFKMKALLTAEQWETIFGPATAPVSG